MLEQCAGHSKVELTFLIKMMKILIPIGLSKVSLHALRYVCALLDLEEVELTLLYFNGSMDIVEERDQSTVGLHEDILSQIEFIQSNGAVVHRETYPDTLTKFLSHGLPERNVDLIVLVNKELRRKGQAFDSDIKLALQNSHIPILIMPAGFEYERIQNIIFPLESAMMPKSFLNRLSAVQEITNAKINVLWVQTPISLVDEQHLMSVVSRQLRENKVQRFKFNMRRSNDLGEGILEFVQKANGQVIVMAFHQGKDFSHVFEGKRAGVNIPVWSFPIASEVGLRVKQAN